MAPSAPNLFTDDDDPAGGLHATGLLPAQHLRALIEQSREIQSLIPIEPEQLQPASLDLRLGATAWRVRASFLPGEAASVQAKIDAFAMHRFELSEAGAVLEKGCVYIVELMERLALKKRTSAIANPKSSIGRIDVFVRLITDHGGAKSTTSNSAHLWKRGDKLRAVRGSDCCDIPLMAYLCG